ncbi:MAG: SdrD B-like domain-containing protein, partial [Candidatus Desantisbacteria bacterium]
GLEGIKVIIFEKGESKEKAKASVTNVHGKACFIDVPAGVYNLHIDLGSVPIDFICVAELEQIIRVEPGKVIELNFPLQKAGTVEGRVFRDENRNGVWDAGETGDHDLMVYANNAPTFTGSGGMYRFSNIPPGKIRIQADKTCLPKGYVMTTPDFFDVELKSEGEMKGIDFGMAEQELEIEF